MLCNICWVIYVGHYSQFMYILKRTFSVLFIKLSKGDEGCPLAAISKELSRTIKCIAAVTVSTECCIVNTVPTSYIY
jgi:hypothetical protein